VRKLMYSSASNAVLAMADGFGPRHAIGKALIKKARMNDAGSWAARLQAYNGTGCDRLL
jgi:hypothetical protein